MSINNLLNEIKDESLNELKLEFDSLLKTAKTDNVQYIQNAAHQLEEALVYLEEGKLSIEDVETLLRKQLIHAQIEANKSAIEVQARIQKTALRLLSLSLVFIKEIGKRIL
ncbi:MAG: hypothetical protein FWD46_00720 [Cystobacterineae bacterium]|nr:hypothetical protein [Cystobacterineae bacterium]